MADGSFNFGADLPGAQNAEVLRSQIQNPLDPSSQGILKSFVEDILPDLNRVQSLTLKSGDTSFGVRGTNVMSLSASAAVSITTITSGYNGLLLTIIFNDANVTLVHDATGNSGTINLGGSNVTSAANTTLQLIHNGTSWQINTFSALSASTGSIGGFSIGSDYIRDAANSFGLASTVTAGDDIRFWAGSTFASRSTAPFRVTESGAVFASTFTTTNNFTISTIFESSSRFSAATGGNGSTTFNTSGATVLSGGNAGSFASLSLTLPGTNSALFSGSPTLSIFGYGAAFNNANNTGEFYIGIGDLTVAGTGHTFTDNHIGFKILKSAGTVSLYGTQGDGATENATSALTTFAENDTFELVLKVNGTSSTDYFWRKNGGSLSSATNLTSNLPTANTQVLKFSSSNVSTATTFNVTLAAMRYSR